MEAHGPIERFRRVLEPMNSEYTDQRGFTLIELMIACAVLVIAVASIAPLVATAAKTDSTMRNDSITVAVTERELERLKALNFDNTSLADGGSSLGTSGLISFSGSGVANYCTTVSLADSDQVGKTATYDVRWNISTITGSNNSLKKITLAAQRTNSNWGYPPVQLTTYKAR